MNEARVLSKGEAKEFYDRFGAKQDTQAFYENPALDCLLEHARFENAESILEFGCGTGRLAADILTDRARVDATYMGLDISKTMVSLAQSRLAGFGERAEVRTSDGSIALPVGDGALDRVISTYVLDLLDGEDISAFFTEAHRALRDGGLLCLSGLTYGTTLPSKALCGIWRTLHRMSPSLVGGCRPVYLLDYLDHSRWSLEHHSTVVTWGVPSEVLVVKR